MIYEIENKILKVAVDTNGAQLASLYSKKTDTEYLWQGDPAYWTGRAYNLFPFIGRMYEGIFRYQGEEYPSRAHGLARYFPFSLETRTATKLVFLFKDNEETHKEYPFAFEFRACFELQNNRLNVTYEVTNTDERTLICAFGGHPGINIPFGKGTFEDYYLEFSEPTNTQQQLLNDDKPYMADKSAPYPLVEGTKLPLRHDLFDHDAIILSNTSRCVSIKCDKERKYVTMHYPDYKFLGVWHSSKTDAPFVCLEPWGALPAIDGTVVDLETKPHMTHVKPNQKAKAWFDLEIHE